MFTKEALLDIHSRSQTTLASVIAHAAGLPSGLVDRELAGFGYGTIRLQVHHAVGAQRYWLSVLADAVDASDDFDDFPDMASLDAMRRAADDEVRHYLDGTSVEDLNRPGRHENWRGETQEMVPALVLMRTITHIHHHVGQVTAMCRLLGHPLDRGIDFAII